MEKRTDEFVIENGILKTYSGKDAAPVLGNEMEVQLLPVDGAGVGTRLRLLYGILRANIHSHKSILTE